jgi:putative oxidoreductase
MIEPQSIAMLLARVFLGILFVFQGYDKLFNVGIRNVTEGFHSGMAGKNIPSAAVKAGAWFTSLAEFTGGGLLILGLLKYIALYILAADIILVSVAFSIIRPMWDLQFVFPRLVLLIFLLLAPAAWDLISMDYLLK